MIQTVIFWARIMREIVIAGAGLGDVTSEVAKAIRESDVVIADSRFADKIPPGKKMIPVKNFPQLENESGRI